MKSFEMPIVPILIISGLIYLGFNFYAKNVYKPKQNANMIVEVKSFPK